MLQRVNHRENHFYNSNKSEYRTHTDIQSTTTNVDGDETTSRSDDNDVQVEYMKEMSK